MTLRKYTAEVSLVMQIDDKDKELLSSYLENGEPKGTYLCCTVYSNGRYRLCVDEMDAPVEETPVDGQSEENVKELPRVDTKMNNCVRLATIDNFQAKNCRCQRRKYSSLWFSRERRQRL